MNSIPSAPKQRKPDLTIEFCHAEPGAPIFVSITSGKAQSDYWCERIPSDFGVGVRFRKILGRQDARLRQRGLRRAPGHGELAP